MKRRWGAVVLCCMLALALLVPVFPLTVSAEDQPLSQEQISNPGGTLHYDANNTNTDKENAVVSVSKTIEGTDKENEFIINLKVETSLQITSSDAAVVLVLDTSTAMADHMQQLKDAVMQFLESGVARYVSIVTYGETATIVSGTKSNGWVDITIPGNLAALENTVRNLTVDTKPGIFMQGGLALARNLWRTEAFNQITDGEIVENRSVILFANGDCNYYNDLVNNADSHNVDYGLDTALQHKGNGGNGSVTDPDTQKWTKEMADTVKTGTAFTDKQGARYTKYTSKLYTIGFGSGTDQKWLLENVATGSDYAYADPNANQLGSIFNQIAQRIMSVAQAWIVTDPMGENIEFIEFVPPSNPDDISGERLQFRDNKIIWDLKNSAPSDVYACSYLIKLDNTTGSFDPHKTYPTNGDTSLSYVVMVNGEITGDRPSPVKFPVPEVKGYLGDLSFVKVGKDSENDFTPLDGCAFIMENQTTGKLSDTVLSESDGSVCFSNIASGYTYTLTEISMPEKWENTYDLNPEAYTITVTLGKVEVKDSNGNPVDPAGFTFINPNTKTIDLIFKKIDGNVFSNSHEERALPGAEFTIYKLSDEGINAGIQWDDNTPDNPVKGWPLALDNSEYWEPYDMDNGTGISSNRVTSDSQGIVILNLKTGCYMLVETKAPHVDDIQYVLPTGQWALKVDAKQETFEIAAVKGTDGMPPAFINTDNGACDYLLPNLHQPQLPLSGAPGIAAFIVIGSSLLIFGTLLYVIYQKRLRSGKANAVN